MTIESRTSTIGAGVSVYCCCALINELCLFEMEEVKWKCMGIVEIFSKIWDSGVFEKVVSA